MIDNYYLLPDTPIWREIVEDQNSRYFERLDGYTLYMTNEMQHQSGLQDIHGKTIGAVDQTKDIVEQLNSLLPLGYFPHKGSVFLSLDFLNMITNMEMKLDVSKGDLYISKEPVELEDYRDIPRREPEELSECAQMLVDYIDALSAQPQPGAGDVEHNMGDHIGTFTNEQGYWFWVQHGKEEHHEAAGAMSTYVNGLFVGYMQPTNIPGATHLYRDTYRSPDLLLADDFTGENDEVNLVTDEYVYGDLHIKIHDLVLTYTEDNKTVPNVVFVNDEFFAQYIERPRLDQIVESYISNRIIDERELNHDQYQGYITEKPIKMADNKEVSRRSPTEDIMSEQLRRASKELLNSVKDHDKKNKAIHKMLEHTQANNHQRVLFSHLDNDMKVQEGRVESSMKIVRHMHDEVPEEPLAEHIYQYTPFPTDPQQEDRVSDTYTVFLVNVSRGHDKESKRDYFDIEYYIITERGLALDPEHVGLESPIKWYPSLYPDEFKYLPGALSISFTIIDVEKLRKIDPQRIGIAEKLGTYEDIVRKRERNQPKINLNKRRS